MRYLRYKSLTWWTGALAIALGLAQAAGWPADDTAAAGVAGTVNDVLGALYGGEASPAALIVLGLGLIGIRDKLERDK